ncbi:MAG: carbamate kinase [Nitrospinae bacterium]|nr:carbamate kinase [Nitrospinota bacterium]
MNPENSPAKPSLLIAFGGNALQTPESSNRQRDEFFAARRSMRAVAELIQNGYEKIVLTHGNGPQVGRIFLQQELTKNEFPRQVTLDVCVADSQGRIGYILQNVFDSVCAELGVNRKCYAVITQAVVDPADPAFQNPGKPIGVFYSAEDAERLARERGWVLREDAGRGHRRVVPSPKPLEIVEKKIFQTLLDQGFIAIGAGGGGIPVFRDATGGFSHGVEAVIDKDRASALLANEIGIDCFVMLTAVDFACLDFNSPRQTPIHTATAEEMETYMELGHFLEGSMKPKVESAIQFVRNGGKRAIIAHLNDLLLALEGKTGTQILPDK